MSALDCIDNLLAILSHHKTKYEDIDTTIIHMRDIGTKYVIDMTNPNGNTQLSPKGIFTTVFNARNLNCAINTYGFQLINQTTSLSTKDFYADPDGIIQSVYYKEIESIIKELTNAEFVKAFEHQIRSNGPKPKYAKCTVNQVADGAHCDFTQYSAINALKRTLSSVPKDGNNYKQGRFALINVWRNISDINRIQNYHLAVMDARTVVAPDDFVKYEFIPPVMTNMKANKYESYYLNASAMTSHHKWYYFPAMKKSEILIFMQYDSDFRSQSRHVFHTAIWDPTFDEDKGELYRESMELRLIAFFPKHTPNTIPDLN